MIRFSGSPEIGTPEIYTRKKGAAAHCDNSFFIDIIPVTIRPSVPLSDHRAVLDTGSKSMGSDSLPDLRLAITPPRSGQAHS